MVAYGDDDVTATWTAPTGFDLIDGETSMSGSASSPAVFDLYNAPYQVVYTTKDSANNKAEHAFKVRSRGSQLRAFDSSVVD